MKPLLADFPVKIPKVPFSASCPSCRVTWVHTKRDKDPRCPKCGRYGFWETGLR